MRRSSPQLKTIYKEPFHKPSWAFETIPPNHTLNSMPVWSKLMLLICAPSTYCLIPALGRINSTETNTATNDITTATMIQQHRTIVIQSKLFGFSSTDGQKQQQQHWLNRYVEYVKEPLLTSTQMQHLNASAILHELSKELPPKNKDDGTTKHSDWEIEQCVFWVIKKIYSIIVSTAGTVAGFKDWSGCVITTIFPKYPPLSLAGVSNSTRSVIKPTTFLTGTQQTGTWRAPQHQHRGLCVWSIDRSILFQLMTFSSGLSYKFQLASNCHGYITFDETFPFLCLFGSLLWTGTSSNVILYRGVAAFLHAHSSLLSTPIVTTTFIPERALPKLIFSFVYPVGLDDRDHHVKQCCCYCS